MTQPTRQTKLPNIHIRFATHSDKKIWDTYVCAHPDSHLYHLYGWKSVIEETYSHKDYYLIASRSIQDDRRSPIQDSKLETQNSTSVVGILPLVHMKHFLFGNKLVSLPFFDMGGILADDEETEKALLIEAIQLGQKLKAQTIELRHSQSLTWLNQNPLTEDLLDLTSFSSQRQTELSQFFPETESTERSSESCKSCLKIHTATKSHKVRMLLELPDSSETLMKSFKSKLRSQVRKPMREGLKAIIGGTELLKDFYRVFSINMRDLGSPVHSSSIMKNVLHQFADVARLIIVYKDDEPVACSLVVGFKDTLENPWASALRKYSRFAPNMLLYWTMLEYACDNGYRYFDFGRSSPGEGTYKFKQQWGSKPAPLHWHYFSPNEDAMENIGSEKSSFEKAIHYWQKLPVAATRILGPMIRKHISL